MSTRTQPARTLMVRRGPVGIPEVPAQVYRDSIVLSHFFNAMSLLFPRGEEFFIDSVRKFSDKTPAHLKADVKAFIGQEAVHGKVHRVWNNNTQATGYDVSRMNAVIETVLSNFERLSLIHPALGLSVTAALEHVTATQSSWFLRNRYFTEPLEPHARDITLWHSCEEIEHRHVAFDLLQVVDDSYALRIGGHLLGQVLLWTGAFVGFGLVLSQEKSASPSELLADFGRNLPRIAAFAKNNVEKFFEYFKPDFHPEDDDARPLAVEYLAEKKIA
jgi:uncharacterized protein